MNDMSSAHSRVRLIETTLLVLAGLLLAIATIDDVVRQGGVNHRLIADLRTWRAYTGHDYRDIGIEQDIYGHSDREIVCGNTLPGPPKTKTQICLALAGPVRGGRRAVRGGYYLPPKVEDLPRYRYGCFGAAARARLCGTSSSSSAGASSPALEGE
jgi:hypothetical protein